MEPLPVSLILTSVFTIVRMEMVMLLPTLHKYLHQNPLKTELLQYTDSR